MYIRENKGKHCGPPKRRERITQ